MRTKVLFLPDIEGPDIEEALLALGREGERGTGDDGIGQCV